MALLPFKTFILKALSDNYSTEEVLSVLRELRNTIALGGRDFQILAISDDEFTSGLVECVDKMRRSSSMNPNSPMAFGVGVQCVANLMNGNDDARRYFADKYLFKFVSWLRYEHLKQQNYVAAVLLNIDKVGGLDLEDDEFLRLLIKSGEFGAEFSVHLLRNLVKSHNYSKLYGAAHGEGKIFLLQLLESAVTDSEDLTVEVQFTCSVYKKCCDLMMTNMSQVNPPLAQEVAATLEFLASLSSKQTYMTLMQEDASLIITSAYLLRGLHECTTQTATWKESLDEAVKTIKSKELDFSNRPFFGVKGNLIRLIGNLVYKNTRNQNEVQDAGCIPIILDSCRLDGDNPFLKEWSILAIRNLCEGNAEIQGFIKGMKMQGYEMSEELSLTLGGGDCASVNIAPLRKK